jgi:hypothetical protein
MSTERSHSGSFLSREVFGEKFILDRKNHLLFPKEIRTCERPTILVTGYPEGPGKLSEDVWLHPILDESMEQLYVGLNPYDIAHMPVFFSKALEGLHSKAQIHAVFFSAGAMALNGFDTLDPRITQVTFISPFYGLGSEKKEMIPPFKKGIEKIFHLPAVDDYHKSVLKLLKNSNVTHVNVILDNNDEFLNTRRISALSREICTVVKYVDMRFSARGHTPTLEELDTILHTPSE